MLLYNQTNMENAYNSVSSIPSLLHAMSKQIIGENEIAYEGAREIGIALQKNHTLTRLGLGAAPIFFNTRIGFNKLGNKGAKEILAVLYTNNTLTALAIGIYIFYLFVEFNGISCGGAKEIAAVLRENRALTSLNLRIIQVVRLLEQTTTVLDMKGQRKLQLHCMKMMCLSIQTLVWLLASVRIGLNKIGYEGAREIAIMLQKNCTLTHLNLSNTSLHTTYSLQRNWIYRSEGNSKGLTKEQSAYQVESLYYHFNYLQALITLPLKVQRQLCQHYRTTLPLLPQISVANHLQLIGNNGIGYEGATIVGIALQNNHVITKLDLSIILYNYSVPPRLQ
eukprot:TRINITY_DN639_c1_g1_i1.p1 TRINITY_DN639_c1_g1~~TRINITY_DN639_c1_g1_i1.p1  ORF type:complete len:336 (+),score=-27.69 TRINITY_DN639_c1_g1_i1:843-1850(+)